MSIYDNFRAPQYVDFAGIHSNDINSDASSFFDRDTDMDSTPSVEGRNLRGSSVSSSNETISDGDTTLTPSRFNSSIADTWEANRVNSSKVSFMPNAAKCLNGTPQTPLNKSLELNCGTGHPFNVVSPFEEFVIPNHRISTPMVHHVNTQVETKKISCGSPQLISVRFTESNSSAPKVCTPSGKTPKPISDSIGNVSRKSRCSNVAPSSNRRSRSACDTKIIITAEDMLNDAIQTLSISSSQKNTPSDVLSKEDQVSSPIQLLPDPPAATEISSKKPQPKIKGGGPKRKLSPPPKNSRDYGQQPAKYISMAEQIALVQKQTPKRFRTLPSTAALKKGNQFKVARNLSTQPKSAPAFSNGSASHHSEAPKKIPKPEGLGDNKGVRVARWPQPKVEPFVLTQYKKKELPKTVFNFEQKESVILRDRKTPYKRVRQTTKVEPFSFDQRDKELLQRKINRVLGVDTQSHCCQTKARRRSRSQGDENCRGSVKQDPLVHHARVPTVLQKPPFVPQKKPHKVTRPIDFCLSTTRRAKEREEFDELVKQKEMERQFLLNKQQEEKRLQEEKEVLKLRKVIVHKARPVPHFHPFKVHPSDAPLTEPSTPSICKHRSKQIKDFRPTDNSMES